MKPQIKHININVDKISEIFNKFNVEHEICGKSSLYVANTDFNYWIQIDSERSLLGFHTYWESDQNADETAVLSFLNECNSQFVMVQFSHNPETSRLKGNYALPIGDGLIPDQLLTIGARFASIFGDAVHTGVEKGLLVAILSTDDTFGTQH